MAKRRGPYSKTTPKQRALKGRAIEVATFVLDLQMRAQAIKEGRGSYKKLLPDDANWWERYGNEMALRRGSIMRQAAEKFRESEKQISRYIKRVVREGWADEVLAEFESDRTSPRAEPGKVIYLRRLLRGRPTVAALRRMRKQRAIRTP
jgi:hypothetical protein